MGVGGVAACVTAATKRTMPGKVASGAVAAPAMPAGSAARGRPVRTCREDARDKALHEQQRAQRELQHAQQQEHGEEGVAVDVPGIHPAAGRWGGGWGHAAA